MHSEERFHQIQQRAYEIYLRRKPDSATPEEDWQKAESEIDFEERFGPERSESDGPTRRLWTEVPSRA
jgi:Protein of unknown function (DUF2934)